MTLSDSAAAMPAAGGPPGAPSGQPRRALARSAGIVGAATTTSRLLGLVREQLLAYLFGAGNAVDAYNVAFRIPNLLRDLFAEGAMSAAFVPTFTRTLVRQGRAPAWRLASNVLTTLGLATGVLVAAGIVFADPIVTLFASEYAQVPGKLELTVQLTRIMLPFLALIAIAAALMGMLNALNRFFVPALSPAMFNVASIATMLLLVPVMPSIGLHPIAAVAAGVIAGGLAQLLGQMPLLRREGFRYRPRFDWRDPDLRSVLLLMGPGTFGLAATQINVFVNTVLATGEGTGAVSWLNYAFRIMYLPLGIIGVSIATAAVPAIARHAERGDRGGMRHEVANGLSMMLMLNLPATAGLIVLAHPIVSLLFERGAFTPEDTVATAGALVPYAVGLAGYSAVRIATPAFYAMEESRTPVLVTAGSVLVNVGLNLLLVRYYGYVGLAVGTSVAALLNATVLLTVLRRRLGGLEGRRLAGILIRTLGATVAMALAAYGLMGALTAAMPGPTLWMQLARLALTIGGALAVLMAAARLAGLREMIDLLRASAARLRRGRR